MQMKASIAHPLFILENKWIFNIWDGILTKYLIGWAVRNVGIYAFVNSTFLFLMSILLVGNSLHCGSVGKSSVYFIVYILGPDIKIYISLQFSYILKVRHHYD